MEHDSLNIATDNIALGVNPIVSQNDKRFAATVAGFFDHGGDDLASVFADMPEAHAVDIAMSKPERLVSYCLF